MRLEDAKIEDAGRAAGPRHRVTWIFYRVEDLVYIGLGFLLAASAIALLGSSAVAFFRGLASGALPSTVIELLDRILLILMIVEILYTVLVSFQERVLKAEPFLIVGLIAATRRILVLTAEFSRFTELGQEVFNNAMIELGLLVVMVAILVASLAVLRKLSAPATPPQK